MIYDINRNLKHFIHKLDSIFIPYIYHQSSLDELDSEIPADESNFISTNRDLAWQPNMQYVSMLNACAAKDHISILRFNALFGMLKIPIYHHVKILPLDSIGHKEICVKKEDLQGIDRQKILLNRAKKERIPINTNECRFIEKSSDDESIIYDCFFVNHDFLLKEELKAKHRIYFLNPLDIFSKLELIYPNLHRYTIIINGDSKHAMATYENGMLVFCVVVDKQLALQSYYDRVELGEVALCNLSKTPCYSYSFLNLCSFIRHDLGVLNTHGICNSYLRLLTANYCSNAEFVRDRAFFPSDFHAVKNRVFAYGLIGIFFLLFIILDEIYMAFLDRLEAHRKEVRQSEMLDKFQIKKDAYTPIYERIYNSMQKNSSLNFSIEQKYDETKGQWIGIEHEIEEEFYKDMRKVDGKDLDDEGD